MHCNLASPAPPLDSPNQEQQQRQHDHQADADDAKGACAEGDCAVFVGAGLDGDECFLVGEPVHHIDAKVDVAAVAGIGVGKEGGAADYDDALVFIVHRAL